jgi:NADPH-dependent glutamate synthase beta subunit-like oxidoreductase
MLAMKNQESVHHVAVIGGATAGAEVASRLADRGVAVTVIEQNARPYGKIEDGLPRWHEALRHKEYSTIDGKLSKPAVCFVPNTRIGEHIGFAELVNDWGFSAVVLANGAWRDRPLPIEGADNYIDRGLVYQNAFVIAFNHAERGDLPDAGYTVHDGALIVGGGLASIDVAKIHTLELAIKAMAERGIETSLLELEVKGIPKVLAVHDLVWEDLGLEGVTIYYRRRVEDMPLMSAPEGADEARIKKVEAGRRRMLDKATKKYRFKVEPLCAPDQLIVENGQLKGMVFRRTRIEAGRAKMTDETFEAYGPAVISSIGSVPEPIEGIALNGELFDFKDWDIGKLEGYPSVFSVGNVVTGKGNIVASRKHAEHVASDAIEAFLGVSDDPEAARDALRDPMTAEAQHTLTGVVEHLSSQSPPSAAAYEATLARVAERQRSVNYPAEDGDRFEKWLALVAPKPR